MALTTLTGARLALELGGQAAGVLRSVQPASVRVEVLQGGAAIDFPVRGGLRIGLGEMAAEADLLEPGPLPDWLAGVMAGDLSPRSGAVVLADHNFNQQRRIAFTDACLTALTWPVLDATETKRPFTLGLRWLAQAVDDGPASGKQKAATASKRKALLTSNFRINGLPFSGAFVSRIELPTLSLSPAAGAQMGTQRDLWTKAALALGELRLTVAARDAAAARTWVRKLVLDGQLDPSEALNLQVELLDAALKKVLASITLQGCQLRGLDESPLGGSTERSTGHTTERTTGSVSLRFAVAGLKLALA